MSDAWDGPKVGVFAILNHTEDQAEQADLEFEYLRDMSKNWHNVKVNMRLAPRLTASSVEHNGLW